MIIGVGPANELYARTSLTVWDTIPDSGPLISLAQLPNGTILGVGADNMLSTRVSIGSQWAQVADRPLAKSVTVMPDGTIVGLGTDDQLYTRQYVGSPWSLVGDGSGALAIAANSAGNLLAAGADHQIWIRASLTSNWEKVEETGSIKDLAVMRDGTIVGVGTDDALYTRTGFEGGWTPLPDSASFRAIAATAVGGLIGAGTDGLLRTIPALPAAWKEVDSSAYVSDLTVMPNGTIVGIGKNEVLMTRESLTSSWTPIPGSGSPHRIAAMPDGGLVAAGGDFNLYYRAALAGSWEPIPNSGSVQDVAVLPDGTIVGLDLDWRLQTRPTLRSDWSPVPNSGSPASISAAPDGSLVAAGKDRNVWTRRTLWSDWKQVPNSGDVTSVAVVPDTAATARAGDWLLQFTSQDPSASDGDGRPWGDGTAIAARARNRELPWDNGSLVTPMVGGFAAMGSMRETFEAAIASAYEQKSRGVPFGNRGCVYVADWLLNPLRDLSESNPWGGEPWDPSTTVKRDQTALGFIVRMMEAGIVVRVLVWMPTTAQASQVKQHSLEHWNLAAAVQEYNTKLEPHWGQYSVKVPIGVVALDLRTAAPLTASLHQKMIVARVGPVNVAYCGGVDLAFTRRDFGRMPNALIGSGDWQSGDTSPEPARGWPKQSPPPEGGYPTYPYYTRGVTRYPEDLPAEVYGSGHRWWHDHHLKLEGPVVATLEQQFAERWVIDTNGRVYTFDKDGDRIGLDNQVQLTSSEAIDGSKVKPLRPAPPCAPVSDAAVQMWRTIPLRNPDQRRTAPFVRGEFTVMAGVAKAVASARELITIWDQYFWSEPLVRLLAARLKAVPALKLLVVIPPYGTTDPANELKYRKNAMQLLWKSLEPAERERVRVFDMWSFGRNLGVYVHAKVQTYDDALLVCGSANMNRRSFECDAELDCAVLHRGTVRAHMAALYAATTGKPWTDFKAGWLVRYWDGVRTEGTRSLHPDPFFVETIRNPETPNHVPMPYDGWLPFSVYDPTSIGPAVQSSTCQFEQCRTDPKQPGRLDEVTYLIERCHNGNDWPWRVAAGPLGVDDAAQAVDAMAAVPEPG